jgi:NAD(P)H dehydrogenase (quinone)
MKNNLIICCSAISDSCSNMIKDKLADTLRKRNENVEIRDLYVLKFDPVITENDIFSASQGQYSDDIKMEQEYLKNSDNIIFIFPIYSSAMPALMKGYIDRVLSQNFAYGYNKEGGIEKLMTGKTVSVFSPMGSALKIYEENGVKAAMDTILTGTFTFRGFEVLGIHYFASDNRKESLDNLENMI